MYRMDNNIQNGNINNGIFPNNNTPNMNTNNNGIFPNNNTPNMNTNNNGIFQNNDTPNMNTNNNGIFSNNNTPNMNTNNNGVFQNNNIPNTNKEYVTPGFTLKNNVHNDSANKKNIKIKPSIVIIIALLLITIGGLVGYMVYVNNPVNLYKGIIKQGYKKFDNITNDIFDSTIFDIKEDSIHMNGSLKLNSSTEEFKEYTKYNYDYDFGLDVKNKKLNLKASISEDSKKILTGIVYLLNKTMYLESTQIYDKVLYSKIDDDFFEVFSEENELPLTHEEIDKMAKKVSNYLINGLSKNHFEKEKDTIYVNGQKVNVTKVIYPINQDNLYELVDSIIKDIKNDDEFIELLAKLTDTNKSEIKDELDDVDIQKSDFEMAEEVEFYLYIKGMFSKIIGFGLEAEDEIISYAKVKNISEMSIQTEDIELIAKTKDNATKGNLKIEDEEMITFTLENEEKNNNHKLKLSLTIKAEDEKLNLDLASTTTKKGDKQINSSISFNIKTTEYGEEIDFGAKITNNIEIGSKINELDTNKAIDINSLTEEQISEIETNFEKIIEDTTFYDLIYSNQSDDNMYYEDDEWYYEKDSWY